MSVQSIGIRVSFSAPSSEGRGVNIVGGSRSVVENFIRSFRDKLQEYPSSTRNPEGSMIVSEFRACLLDDKSDERSFSFECLIKDSLAYRVFLMEKLGVSEEDIQRKEKDYQRCLQWWEQQMGGGTTTKA